MCCRMHEQYVERRKFRVDRGRGVGKEKENDHKAALSRNTKRR